MVRKTLLLIIAPVIAVAVIVIVMLGVLTSSPSYKPAIELTPREMPPFTLTNQYGEKFSLSDASGKAVMLYFGYVNCPDVCPIVMSRFAYILKNLTPAEKQQIALIFITTDPERDTVDTIRKYVKLFNEEIIALTGTKEELKKIWDAYGFQPIYTEKDEKGNYFVTHPAFVLVADKNHVLKFALTPEMPPEEYLQAARYAITLS